MKKILFILLFLFLSVPCFADDVTGKIDFCMVSGSVATVQIDSVWYESSNQFLNDVLIYAFRYGQDVQLFFTPGPNNNIDSVSLSAVGEYYLKIVSMIIGALSCSAFAFGLGVKFS